MANSLFGHAVVRLDHRRKHCPPRRNHGCKQHLFGFKDLIERFFGHAGAVSDVVHAGSAVAQFHKNMLSRFDQLLAPLGRGNLARPAAPTPHLCGAARGGAGLSFA